MIWCSDHSGHIPYRWSQSCKSKKIFCILCYLFNININKTPQLIRSLVRADSVSQTFFVPSSQMINLLSTNNRYPPDKAAKCLIVMNDKCSFSLYCTRLLTSSSSARRSQPCRELLESQWLVELQTKVCKDFTIMEKAPTRAFSSLKAATSNFTFKTLC